MAKIDLRDVETAYDPRLTDESPDPDWWNSEGEALKLPLTAHQLLPESQGVSQRASIEELMDLALAGEIPRYRELKDWEPDRLNARHLQIILMKAAGMKHNRIAELVGVVESNVSIVVNHPDAQFVLARIIGYAAENVVDIKERIKGMAPMILERMSEVIMTTKNEKTISQMGFGLLDRGGYGAILKSEGIVKHEVAVPAKQMGLLTDAIRESAGIVEVDYVIVASEMINPPGGAELVRFGSEGGPGATEVSTTYPSAEDVGALPPANNPQAKVRIA